MPPDSPASLRRPKSSSSAIILSSRDDQQSRSANGCVICLETPACPVCPSGQVCNLSAQTCDSCSSVSCVASTSAYIENSSVKKPTTVSTSDHLIGPLIGGIVAGIAVISVLVFLFFFLRKRKKLKKPASFPDKIDEQEKLEAAASIDNKANTSGLSSPTTMYTYSKHQSFNPRLTGMSATTYDDDETATNYEEPLTIQQQLNYIKKQQLKLQREEIKERQRLYMQQSTSSPTLAHHGANYPATLSPYDSYIHYAPNNGQLNHPSPTSPLHRLGHDSIVSESSVNSVEIRDGHASNIIPIAYIPGVTSNFSSTFASSSSSIRSNNHINSSNSILALSAAQQQRLSAAPTDTIISHDSRTSYVPVHSAAIATRAQPQLVVTMKYPMDADMISIAPDLDRRPEELRSLKSSNKSNNSFSDLDSLDSKGLDNENYNDVDPYLMHGATGTNGSSVASSLNGSEAISNSNNNNNNDTKRPRSTASRTSTSTSRSPWRGPMSTTQRNSQRSSYRSSSFRNSQRTSQAYRLSLRDSTSDDTWRLQPFDYPVVFDNDEDISFVK